MMHQVCVRIQRCGCSQLDDGSNSGRLIKIIAPFQQPVGRCNCAYMNTHTPHTRRHRTFVAAAGSHRVDLLLLHAGRQAQLALVVVGVAVAAAHQREGLARARLTLALVEDAAGAPGADHPAAGLWGRRGKRKERRRSEVTSRKALERVGFVFRLASDAKLANAVQSMHFKYTFYKHWFTVRPFRV